MNNAHVRQDIRRRLAHSRSIARHGRSDAALRQAGIELAVLARAARDDCTVAASASWRAAVTRAGKAHDAALCARATNRRVG